MLEKIFHKDVDGGGWHFVRRVASGSNWHPAQDRLIGSAEYGAFELDTKINRTFSRKFMYNPFDEFLFTWGDVSNRILFNTTTVSF